MKELEQKLDSREVAEMMEVQHKDLLKKIDTAIIEWNDLDNILKSKKVIENL